MKEHPIIFSDSMVRAVLDGKKTQTRRIVKKQPNIDPKTGDWLFNFSDGKQEVYPINRWIDIQLKLHCPFGKVGDRLWVREVWSKRPGEADAGRGARYVCYRADSSCYIVHYRQEYTNGEKNKAIPLDGWFDTPKKWKPSIHMPRTASRILLEITGVRIERLIDISEDDAIAEGIDSFRPVPGDGPAETMYRNYDPGKTGRTWTVSPRFSFSTLWESIFGPQSFGANPWVWVISFSVVDK